MVMCFKKYKYYLVKITLFERSSFLLKTLKRSAANDGYISERPPPLAKKNAELGM